MYNISMILFDGKLHAQKLEQDIQTYLATRGGAFGAKPKLAIIQIGKNDSSEKYINLKTALCQRLGLEVVYTPIEEHLSYDETAQIVQRVFSDTNVGGGIIQLPLPRPEFNSLLSLIPADKDVDFLSPASQVAFYENTFLDTPSLAKLPPVVRAFKYFLETNDINLNNMDVAVIGQGFLVGKPIAHYAKILGAGMTIIDNYKPNVPLNYQLLVLSAGSPNLVKCRDVKPGCHVVDFGSSVVEGKTVGDLQLEAGCDHLGFVSPSPGGMGPLVVRFLVKNLLGI